MHPERAISEAWRILKPGGRIVVMDLLKHSMEETRELYADVWLGFSQVDLSEMLRKARFRSIEIAAVHREEDPPYFETLLATAVKASSVRQL